MADQVARIAAQRSDDLRNDSAQAAREVACPLGEALRGIVAGQVDRGDLEVWREVAQLRRPAIPEAARGN